MSWTLTSQEHEVDKEYVEYGLSAAKDALYMGYPVEEMSRDELLALVGILLQADRGGRPRMSAIEASVMYGARECQRSF